MSVVTPPPSATSRERGLQRLLHGSERFVLLAGNEIQPRAALFRACQQRFQRGRVQGSHVAVADEQQGRTGLASGQQLLRTHAAADVYCVGAFAAGHTDWVALPNRQSLERDVVRRRTAGLQTRVGLRVSVATQLQQLFRATSRIPGQIGARGVVPDSLHHFFCRHLQGHDHRLVDGFEAQLAPHQATTAYGDDGCGVAGGERGQQLLALRGAERGLALVAKNARNRSAKARLNPRIQIDEGPARKLGDPFADAGFTTGHEAVDDERPTHGRRSSTSGPNDRSRGNPGAVRGAMTRLRNREQPFARHKPCRWARPKPAPLRSPRAAALPRT